MKRSILSVAVVLGVFLVAAPAFGGSGLSGPHFNLNIIGVEHPKSQYQFNGHTIFVALGSKTGDYTRTNIWLTQGPFEVCDGNGFDRAYDCNEQPLGSKTGAVFQLPCDTNIPTDVECTGFSQNYTVWIRALGQPGGTAHMRLCATDDLGNLVCNTGENVVSLTAHGKRTFTNVTRQLTTLQDVCFDIDGTPFCGDVPLFDQDLIDYVWQYDNNGLRLAQLRFYIEQP